MSVTAILLAAGEGTRMKSKHHKVLSPLCGRALIDYIVDAVRVAGAQRTVVVVGHGAQDVRAYLQDTVLFATQDREKGKGTGFATMSAAAYIQDGIVFVLAGDMPLIGSNALMRLREAVEAGASCAILTAMATDPTGYGRVIRKGDTVQGIVEQIDCTKEQLSIAEINASAFCFDAKTLANALPRLTNHNNQNEYYLTDVVGMIATEGGSVVPILTQESDCMGINDRVQLAQATQEMRRRIGVRWMLDGVTLLDPQNTYIDSTVTIGRDTVVYPGCMLQGDTRIGEDCVLLPNCRLQDAHLEDGVTVDSSVLIQCSVGANTTIGPFAYLRPHAQVGEKCRIGDFVEIKNATIGAGTKVSHLSYVGDATLGSGINVGCGVVFSNYDGKKKHHSVVEDGAFIGCNVNLVSPVHVEKGAYIAAGSTITKDVPGQSLAIARAKQSNLLGWVSARQDEGKL